MTVRDEEITGKDGNPAGSGALTLRREKLPRIESERNHAKIATPLGAPCASNCGKKFPGESESEKRRVVKRKQVCVNPGKSSPDPVRYKNAESFRWFVFDKNK